MDANQREYVVPTEPLAPMSFLTSAGDGCCSRDDFIISVHWRPFAVQLLDSGSTLSDCKTPGKPAQRRRMSTVAETLRHAREARNLTHHQVAEITKVRADHVRALEEGNFDVFSAPVYIRGFVRTYAKLLKLDVPEIIAALDAELGRTEKFREPPPLSDQSRGPLDFIMLQLTKVDWRKALIVLAGVFILAGVIAGIWAWRHYQSADLQPGLYQPTREMPGETLPVPAPPRR
jgi:transcriptional regulator with XRE-family HTH domain